MEASIIITKILLPRIRKLEEELATLREQTFPYVQAQKEDTMGSRGDMRELIHFFKHLDDETIVKLLRMKGKFSKNPGVLDREIDFILRGVNNSIAI